MNNKKWFKSLVASLLAVTAVGSMAACGGGGGDTSSSAPSSAPGVTGVAGADYVDTSVTGSLNLRLWEGGYGVQWLKNAADGFMQRYPNVTVKVTPTVERQTVYVEAVGGINKLYDIYFTEANMYTSADKFVDLSDVYATTNPEESKTVGSKIDPMFANAYKKGSTVFGIPSYAGSYGVAYNTDIFSEIDAEFPVTSDGWTALCAQIKEFYGTGKYALIFSGDQGVNYWHGVADTYAAQYLGVKAYDNMIVGKNADGTAYAPEVSYDISQKYAAKAIEDVLWYEKGYIHPSSTGMSYLQAQDEFMGFTSAAMMVNGSWLMNEMAGTLDQVNAEFQLAKIPVLSAIINHPNCASIADDAELTALINAIDKGQTALTGEGYEVEQKAFDHVKEARSLVHSTGTAASGVIPKVIDDAQKALAKKFLAYMYSDMGIVKVAQANFGATLPVVGYKDLMVQNMPAYEPKMEAFLEDSYELLFNAKIFFKNNNTGAISAYVFPDTITCYEVMYGSATASDRMTAEAAYNLKVQTWSANNNAKYHMEMLAKGFDTSLPLDPSA